MRCSLLALGCVLAVSGRLGAQPAGTPMEGPQATVEPGRTDKPQDPQPPAYRDLRFLEDWDYLRDPARRTDYMDDIKHIPLGEGGSYLSLGGEFRLRFDFIRNANFGYAPATNLHGFYQRYMLHADTHLGKHVRVFTQFASSLEDGKKGGPWPTDRNTAEVHQAFVDISTSENPAGKVTLRLGRQELAFGQSHFISTANYFNTRRSFDGIRLQAFKNSLEFNFVVAKPVQVNPGAFDDSPEHRQTFTAAGIFGPNPLSAKGRTALFYIGLDNKQWCWERGCGRDQRHTLGARIQGSHTHFDYTYELLFQFGTFRETIPIRAWAITTDTGYNMYNWRFFPRFGLRSNIMSGDRGHGSLNTFNPMFPDSAYSGIIGLIGPSNSIDISPNLRLALGKRFYFIPDLSTYWRQNTSDGIYGILYPNLTFSGATSRKRHIGTQFSLPLQINISRHLIYQIGFTHFFAGAFVKDLRPPGKSVNFLSTLLYYTF